MTNVVSTTWADLTRVWRWVVGVSGGTASLIAAYFAVTGFIVAMDAQVVTEAEAAEQAKAQLLVLDQYALDLAAERRQREINDTVLELQRIEFQISYLNNLGARTPDQQLQLETIRMFQGRLRDRIRYLRCLDDGRSTDECAQ